MTRATEPSAPIAQVLASQGEANRLPLTLALASLVSFFALYLTSRSGQGLIILAALLMSSYVFRWRIPHVRIVRWTARLVPMCAITLILGWPEDDIMQWYVKPEYTDLAGYLLATEIVIQSYLRRPKRAVTMNDPLRDPVRLRESHGLVALLSGGVMLMACNTYDRSNMQVLVPVYLLLLVPAMRSMARLGQPTGRGAVAVRRRASLMGLRGFALLLALSLGFAGVFVVVEFEQAITNWVMDLANRDRGRRSEIGLSGASRLQSTFNPAASLNRVLLIEGRQAERHLRALAYDTYEDRSWHPTLRQREYVPGDLAAMMTAREGERLIFRRIGDTLDLLPVPLEAVSIEPPEPVDVDALGVMRTPDRGTNLRYQVVVGSPVEANRNPLMRPPTEEELPRLLKVPDDIDPAVAELARQVAGQGTAVEKVFRLQQYLRTNYTYSLSFKTSGEPLSDFILNLRSGHCQFFASALVVMSRAVGVPARMAGGYYVHERYGDDQMVVRDRDAHAWAEVFIDGMGWMTADATPAGGRPDALFEEPSRWRQAWERASDIPRIVQEWLSEVGREAVLWFVLAISLAALGTWMVQHWLGVRRRTRAAAQRAYPAASAELVEMARRFDRVLDARGTRCADNRTWREHLAALRGQLAAPIDLEVGARFIDAYDEARFGGENGTALQRVRELLSQLETR